MVNLMNRNWTRRLDLALVLSCLTVHDREEDRKRIFLSCFHSFFAELKINDCFSSCPLLSLFSFVSYKNTVSLDTKIITVNLISYFCFL